MAEALVNRDLGGQWVASSAGVRPAGYVHPMAVQVLAEIGIQHHGRSKGVEEVRGQTFDLVVTVCNEAAEECPVWLGKGRTVHLGFADPAKAVGAPEEVLGVFRSLRDEMRVKVEELLGRM
jgi:arsenate reductase